MMKKLTAMLLALCMLLAVVPALGADLSGDWYMVLEDVTVGTVNLNADGTFAIHMAISDEEYNVDGTWEATETGAALTAQGETLNAVYDAETDTMLADKLPIPMQREAGKYDVAMVAAVMTGKEVELPEGVTEIELMTVAVKFATAAMKLSGSGTEVGGETPDAPASSGTGVDILAENFVVTESYSGFEGTYIAKVQNNTGSPLWLTGGSLVVKDASGNLAGTRDYLSSCASKYLEPGEISVVTISVDLEQNGEYTYEKSIKAETSSYRASDVTAPVADPVFTDGKYDNKYCKATVTNDTDSNMAGLNVAFLLSDANGLPVALVTEALYNHELCANSSIVMVSSLYSRLVDYLNANSITPTVEAFAWVEND